MKLWLILITLSFVSLNAGEVQFFRGISTDREWPHRYIIEVRGDDVVVHVEQKIEEDLEWFSWGDGVKTGKVTKGSISFNCPWGVIGKALSVVCVFKFEKISEEGFDAILTVKSFQDDKSRTIKFTRVSREQLAPAIKALIKKKAE